MVETAKPWPSLRKAARTVVSEGRASNAGTSVADGEEGSELPSLSLKGMMLHLMWSSLDWTKQLLVDWPAKRRMRRKIV